MSNGTSLSARIAEDFDSAAHATQRPERVHRRRAALEALLASGLPGSREENWKYANLRPLERLRFVAVPRASHLPDAPADLPAPLPGFVRQVFVDGTHAPTLSSALAATAAQLQTLTGAGEDELWAASPDERFALLNAAFATDGMGVRVPAGTAVPALLELLFIATAAAEAGASYPRVAVQLEPGAQLVLVERHLSAGAAASFVNSAVTAEVGEGASLQHYRLQQLSERSIAFDTLSATVARGAAYRIHSISTGAQAARSTTRIRLAGGDSELRLAAAALGERQQVQDAYALVEHAAPRARTEQIFRGIAAARARVAFNGKIVVAAGAQGTDSRQSLRGLLAGPEAEIDVRPQLEIHTDEVRCSHGATAGKLDEGMLFYLLSRGLAPEAARRLLKWAFLEDVVAKIELPVLRRQIEEHLAVRLQDDGLRELL